MYYDNAGLGALAVSLQYCSLFLREGNERVGSRHISPQQPCFRKTASKDAESEAPEGTLYLRISNAPIGIWYIYAPSII